jgi:chromate reductase
MPDKIHLLGFAGSLRQGSYNRALLRAAEELLPEGVTLETFDISPIPLYNDDVRLQGDPESVRLFKERIAAADALLVVTPEYNFSIPGVLKNTIDWASRPPDSSPLRGKPVGVMGASTGLFGTVRAQAHLRQVFLFNDMHALSQPQVMVARAQEKFDEQGRLTDEATREHVRKLLEALAAWTVRLRD